MLRFCHDAELLLQGDIRYHYYRCYRRASKLEDKCPINQIRTSEIDRVVMEQVLAILKSRDFFVQYISHHHEFDVSTAFALFNSLDDVWNSLFETENAAFFVNCWPKLPFTRTKSSLMSRKPGWPASLPNSRKITGSPK